MISFTHVFKVFNNISASSWAKTWKRFQIEKPVLTLDVRFRSGSVNLLTTALVVYFLTFIKIWNVYLNKIE